MHQRTETRRRSGWTDERRARQAEAIRRWAPWTRSTGPRTSAGKAVSSRNAVLRGRRAELSAMRKAVQANFREAAMLMRAAERYRSTLARRAARRSESAAARLMRLEDRARGGGAATAYLDALRGVLPR
jgi:hypothetical protein